MSLKDVVKLAVRKAAKDISKDLDLQRIKSRLEELPGEIYHQKSRVNNCRQLLIGTASIKNLEESILISMIACEVGDNGKPKHSNKEARDAELFQRKITSPPYRDAEEKYKKEEQDLSNAQVQLEQLQDEFRSLRMVAKISCKELALLGLEDDEEDEVDVY